MQQQDEPQPGEEQQHQATAIAAAPQKVRPDECSVCLSVYTEVDRRPRTLPCGHTYCSLCVSLLLEDGRLTCPSCRADHCAPNVDHFPINYTVEAMMKVMRTLQVEAASPASGEALQATEAGTKERAAAGLGRKMQSVVQEQKVSLESLKTTLEKEVQQLNQYRAKLAASQTEHTRLLQELDKLVQQHQASVDQLQEEDAKVEGLVAEGQEAHRELEAAQDQLDQVNTAEEAVNTIDVADHSIVQVEKWLQHSRKEIPNGTVLRTSVRVLETTKVALKVIAGESVTTPDKAASGHTNVTVMEAVESVEGGPVELVDLRTKRLKEKIKAGRVFATQKYRDNSCYSSKVLCEENKVYLHALKNEPPPLYAFTLQMNNALKGLSYRDISVFLDLTWPWPRTSERVHIKLVDDTGLIRQFTALCLGLTGLTYRNTSLLTVENYNNCRIVWGGDISGQKPLVDPVHPTHHNDKVVVKPGMVVARTNFADATERNQFGIVLRFCDCDYPFNPSLYHLGTVDAVGLGVVEGAVNDCLDLKCVEVRDCGVCIK